MAYSICYLEILLTSLLLAFSFFLDTLIIISQGGGIRYYKKRLPKLILPYLFFTVVYIVLDFLLLHTDMSFMFIIKCLLTGSAASPLYYIVVLVFVTLLSPFFHSFCKKRTRIILIAIGCLFIMLIGYYALFAKHINAWGIIKLSPIWSFFYVLGIIAKDNSKLIHWLRFYKKPIYLCIICSFGLEIIETIIIARIDGFDFAYSQMRISGFIYAGCTGLAFLCEEKDSPDKNSFLATIGDTSYFIYCAHYGFIMLFNVLIFQNVHIECLPARIIFQFTFSLVGSFFLFKLLGKIKITWIRSLLGVR